MHLPLLWAESGQEQHEAERRLAVRTEMSPALSLAPKPPPAITCSLWISSQPSRALPLDQEAYLWVGMDSDSGWLQYGLPPVGGTSARCSNLYFQLVAQRSWCRLDVQ